jgi:hypothetical protein
LILFTATAFSCCGIDDMHGSYGDLVHLCLRGRRPTALVQDEEDWQALSTIAKRMLFWCGGSIHACRCEGRDMRFAVGLGHAPIGTVARHVSGPYAAHLRRRHGWTGGIFNSYVATSVDGELFLDELVTWLHRPPQSDAGDSSAAAACWTADRAYLIPHSSTWITTDRALAAFSSSGAGRSAYLRRKTQPVAPEMVAILTGTARRSRQPSCAEHSARSSTPLDSQPLSIEAIARFVADYSRVSYDDMRSASRRRVVSRATMVAAVLATRNGASVAAVARLFGRSRSTLIERVDHYRESQSQLFVQAERALGQYSERNGCIGSVIAG